MVEKTFAAFGSLSLVWPVGSLFRPCFTGAASSSVHAASPAERPPHSAASHSPFTAGPSMSGWSSETWTVTVRRHFEQAAVAENSQIRQAASSCPYAWAENAD